MLVLYISVICVLYLSGAVVRVPCLVVCVGLCLASVVMLLPILILSVVHVCKTVRLFCFVKFKAFYETVLVQRGTASPMLALHMFVIGVPFLNATVRG